MTERQGVAECKKVFKNSGRGFHAYTKAVNLFDNKWDITIYIHVDSLCVSGSTWEEAIEKMKKTLFLI
jgi:hypothetical protein